MIDDVRKVIDIWTFFFNTLIDIWIFFSLLTVTYTHYKIVLEMGSETIFLVILFRQPPLVNCWVSFRKKKIMT